MIRLKLLVLAAFAVLVLGWSGVGLLRADDRMAQCDVGGGINEVEAAFEIPAANRIWEYFPNLGISPELAEDGNPVYVVVFRGEVTLPGGRQPGDVGVHTANDVICVIKQDFAPIWYADVSRVGFPAPDQP